MAGTQYPSGIDGFTQIPILVDGVSPVSASDLNVLRGAAIAIETELGIDPSGTFGDVKSRLNALDSLIALVANGGVETGTSLLTDFISVSLEAPIDKTYSLVTNMPYDGYMFSVTTKSSAGTATGTTAINGVALGGGTNAISTTEETVFHSTARSFLPGDDISFTISANAASADVTATMVFVRFVDVTTGGVGVEDVSADATLSSDNHTLFVTTGASTVTLTLPLAASLPSQRYEIKKVDSGVGSVSVARSGSDIIDGATTTSLGSQYDSVTIVSDGSSNWFII